MRYPFKLWSPKWDQRCKKPWLRPLFVCRDWSWPWRSNLTFKSNFMNVWFLHQSKYKTRVNTKTSFDLLQCFQRRVCLDLQSLITQGWGHSPAFEGALVSICWGGGHSHPVFLLFEAIYWIRQPRKFQHLRLLNVFGCAKRLKAHSQAIPGVCNYLSMPLVPALYMQVPIHTCRSSLAWIYMLGHSILSSLTFSRLCTPEQLVFPSVISINHANHLVGLSLD